MVVILIVLISRISFQDRAKVSKKNTLITSISGHNLMVSLAIGHTKNFRNASVPDGD